MMMVREKAALFQVEIPLNPQPDILIDHAIIAQFNEPFALGLNDLPAQVEFFMLDVTIFTVFQLFQMPEPPLIHTADVFHNLFRQISIRMFELLECRLRRVNPCLDGAVLGFLLLLLPSLTYAEPAGQY